MRSTLALRSSMLTAIFFLLSVWPAHAQCGVNTVGFGDVGIVPDNPFHAEIATTVPARSDLAPGTLLRLTSVARDMQGRVRTERIGGEFKHDNGPQAGTEEEQHMITICDPVAQTLTRIDTLNQTAKIIHSRPSAPNSSRLRPGVSKRTFCSSRFVPNRASRTPAEDLGDKTIEGVQAHGERVSLPALGDDRGDLMNNTTSERWCSEELSALVLVITENAKSGSKTIVAMQKIDRTEPDASLFQIPADYAVTESVAEAHERSTGQPAQLQPAQP